MIELKCVGIASERVSRKRKNATTHVYWGWVLATLPGETSFFAFAGRGQQDVTEGNVRSAGCSPLKITHISTPQICFPDLWWPDGWTLQKRNDRCLCVISYYIESQAGHLTYFFQHWHLDVFRGKVQRLQFQNGWYFQYHLRVFSGGIPKQ